MTDQAINLHWQYFLVVGSWITEEPGLPELSGLQKVENCDEKSAADASKYEFLEGRTGAMYNNVLSEDSFLSKSCKKRIM